MDGIFSLVAARQSGFTENGGRRRDSLFLATTQSATASFKRMKDGMPMVQSVLEAESRMAYIEKEGQDEQQAREGLL